MVAREKPEINGFSTGRLLGEHRKGHRTPNPRWELGSNLNTNR